MKYRGRVQPAHAEWDEQLDIKGKLVYIAWDFDTGCAQVAKGIRQDLAMTPAMARWDD